MNVHMPWVCIYVHIMCCVCFLKYLLHPQMLRGNDSVSAYSDLNHMHAQYVAVFLFCI